MFSQRKSERNKTALLCLLYPHDILYSQSMKTATGHIKSDPATNLLDHLFRFWTARSLIAAANLGVADHVRSTPRHIDDIARDTNTDSMCLCRLLRGLSNVNIFHETADSFFIHTPTSELLRTEDPGKMRDIFRAFNFPEILAAWADFEDIIRTGSSTFSSEKIWDIFSTPEESTIYQNAMSANTKMVTEEILKFYDFSKTRNVADIGGGRGTLLAALLQQYPNLKGILLERPEVVEDAREFLRSVGLDSRCDVQGADFHRQIPNGCDVYFLKNILHGLTDEDALQLLKRIHRASIHRPRLFICEMTLPENNLPHIGKAFDLFMLLGARSARLRHLSEIKLLLQNSGFELVSSQVTSLGVTVLECRQYP